MMQLIIDEINKAVEELNNEGIKCSFNGQVEIHVENKLKLSIIRSLSCKVICAQSTCSTILNLIIRVLFT